MFIRVSNTVIFTLLCLSFAAPVVAESTDKPQFPGKAKRVLFLGDSITHAGHYVAMLDARLRARDLDAEWEMINLGLPSETCSGLSEPDHPFPRPDVHERLDRALAKVKPDLVVACYGMNDGIYYPFSEERFAAYRKGVDKLISKVRGTGARLVLMTPPAFDPLPLKKKGKLRDKDAEKFAWFAIYEDYDSVLKKYAAYLMTLQSRDDVALVVDLHTAVSDYVAAKRKQNPDFTMSPDGVHVNVEGHRVLADAIMRAWGYGEPRDIDPAVLKAMTEKHRDLHNAWLSHVGHKRPGMKAGPPIKEAEAKAQAIEARVRKLLESK